MKKNISIFFLVLFLLFPNTSKAARTCMPTGSNYEASVKIDKEQISIGEKAFLSVETTSKYQVTYKTNQVGYIDLSEEGIIRALKDGKVKIDATIDFLDNDEIQASCSLSIPLTIVSNDSSLKKLTLEEYDISPIFNSEKYDYEIKLPYRFDKINIIAEANNENATITGAGRRYLNEGTNDYDIVVTASDGSTSTYKIKIIRNEANSDATLENLIVEGYVLEPKFSKDVYEYNLEVGKEVNEIKINAIPTYEYADLKGIGTFKLATGKNTYYVTVGAENGNETKYLININKNKGTSKLKTLEVTGYDLSPSFNSDTYIYNLTVKSNVSSLDLKAEANDNEQVEINGNEDFKTGENEIIIRVTSEDTTTTTYKLIVNKLSPEEEIKIEKNDNLLKILLGLFIVSIIFMALFIGIFVKRNFPRKYKIKNIKKNKNKKKKGNQKKNKNKSKSKKK